MRDGYGFNEGFTLTVNVEKATTVDFAIYVSSTADYSFDYAAAVTAITLNGSESGVVRNEGVVTTIGWNTSDASAINVASLSLNAGDNVIAFTMGADTEKTLNISSVEFKSSKYVKHNHLSAYTTVVDPTYDSEGSYLVSCNVCGEIKEEILPVITEENGYTKAIDGVLSRWTYAIGGLTFDINETVETTSYIYGVEAWYVGFNDGARVFENGYKYTNAIWNANGYFGDTGKTYLTTIVASEPTTVTLIVNAARNKAKPFFTAGVEHVMNALQVNGSADNVILDMNSTLSIEGWEKFNNYDIATLFLSEGNNVISFTTATTTNFKGIGFKSTKELHMHTDVIDVAVEPICTAAGLTQGIHCSDCNEVIVEQEEIPVSGSHAWSEEYTLITKPTYVEEGKIMKKCINCNTYDEESTVTLPVVLTANGYTKVSEATLDSTWEYVYNGQTFSIVVAYPIYDVSASDPFSGANGSIKAGSKVPWTNNAFWQNAQKATFTTKINASSDATVTLVLRVVAANGKISANNLITSVLLDGSAEGVTRVNGSFVCGSDWTIANSTASAPIATLSLKQGENTISFTMADQNYNIVGIAYQTPEGVTLSLPSNDRYYVSVKGADIFVENDRVYYEITYNTTLDPATFVFFNGSTTYTYESYKVDGTTVVFRFDVTDYTYGLIPHLKINGVYYGHKSGDVIFKTVTSETFEFNGKTYTLTLYYDMPTLTTPKAVA